MRIALAQTNIVWENKHANIVHAEEILDKLQNKADLVLFPEMSFTGFSMNTGITTDKDGETIATMEKLSEKYNISIGFGWTGTGDRLARNHYTIIAPAEGVKSDYVKIHPFSYSDEDKYFEGGDRLSEATLHNFNIATAICYDLRFPELFQLMSKKADIIIVPANWPAKRREHWIALLRARAIENQCYIAGINCCGSIGKLEYSGDTGIYNPDGRIMEPIREIAIGKKIDEKILIYEIVNDVAQYRKSFPVKKDRRYELYRQLNDSIY